LISIVGTANAIAVFGKSVFGGISNSGTIAAGSHIGILISNLNTTFSGAINNSGSISSTVTAIDVSGANNAITINQTAGSISGAVKLSANADVFNITGGTVVGDVVGQGAGTLNFNLGANTTYTDSNVFTGLSAANIQSGTVALTGTADSSTNMTVSSGATLQGTAALTTALNVLGGGTFAPGTTTTKMTITGSLMLQSAAVYMVTLTGLNASGANVIGAANITSATFAVASGSTAVVGHNYLVLQTTSVVTGQFSNAKVFIAGGLQGKLDYTTNPDDVFLDVSFGTLAPLLPPGTPQNALNVANAIDSFITGGGTLPANFQNIFNFTPAQIVTALTQLDGETSTGADTSQFALVNDFFNLLSDMALGSGGGGGTGSGATGFAATPHDMFPSDLARAYDEALKQGQPSNFEQRWTAWGSGFGGYATYNGNATVGSSTLHASDYGFAGGMDYRAAPDLKFGFALAGAGTNWSLSQNLGSGRSDVFQIAGYGIKHFGPAYFTAMAAFGNAWITTNRTAALGDQLRATFNGQSYALRGEAGYRFAVLPMAGITPYLAAQTQWFHTPSYSETDLNGGGFGLAFNSQTVNDTRSEVGARADDLTMFNGTPLVLRGRLAWAHDWVSSAALGAIFQALPGSAFTVNGAAVPKNSTLASAGAQWYFAPNWSVEAKFDGEFASTAQTYSGTGTLRYSW
jgi:uncharacterized protein with beta-barrel porin domain